MPVATSESFFFSGMILVRILRQKILIILAFGLAQARVPVGRTILELPAGMLDDNVGDFVGTAAHEVYLRELFTTFFGP